MYLIGEKLNTNSCPNKKTVGSLLSLTDTFLSLILDASCAFNPEQKINSNKTYIINFILKVKLPICFN